MSASMAMAAELHRVTPGDFKLGMRRLASGVVIVSTRHGGVCHGLVATAVTSVTADPPTLMVCINRTASSYVSLTASGRFCINVLDESDAELAARFASPHDREGRFGTGKWTRLATGSPVLEGSLVSFDCVLAERLEASTHTICFGEVVGISMGSGEIRPLLYWDGGFRRLEQRG